jgi:hypothetical protein
LVACNGHVKITDDNAHAWVEVYMDGVGWLPVDVTPGCYSDTSMFEDTYRYTDNEDDEIDDAVYYNSIDNTEGGTDSESIIKKLFIFVAGRFYGLLTLMLMLLILAFFILEVQRFLRRKYSHKVFDSLDEKRKMLYAFKKIYKELKYMGIDTDLNQNPDYIDDQLCEKFKTFRKSEYNRVYSLIEKVVYGEQTLEPYEERVVLGFADKLAGQIKILDFKSKFKYRYYI